MATLNGLGGTIDIDMTDIGRVSHAAQAAPANASQYSWTTGGGNTITVHSFADDITFNATAPTGGSVHAIQAIDSYTVGGVFGSLVSMTAAPNLENYWLPILAGETTILASTIASFNGAGDFLLIDAGEARTGGDDLFEGAPLVDAGDQQSFFGDALSVQNAGVLNGGDDTINMRTRGRISGDVDAVLGRLNGGDDTIVIDGPGIGSGSSTVVGDAIFNSDGRAGFNPVIDGGDDFIDVVSFVGPLLGGGSGPIGGISGDIFFQNAGQTTGGNDTIDGGDNPFFFEASGDAQTVNNGTVFGGNDRLVASASEFCELTGDVEVLNGGTLFAGADRLIGGDGGDSLFGDVGIQQSAVLINATFTGDDVIFGNGGDDFMLGQVGDDVLDGGLGNDIIDGGSNTAGTGDTATFDGLNIAVSADLSAGFAFGQGTDTLIDIESLRGSNKSDALGGNAVANRLEGLNGSDDVFGRNGNDKLLGGNGGDTLRGNEGNDVMTGGAGSDNLAGGLDKDIFDYNAISESGTTAAARDVISGFVQGGATGDRFDLSTIDAKAATAINDDFTFIGGAAFSAEGQIRFTASGGLTVIEVNTIGNAVADMTIAINGTFALLASDFI